jgi:Bacterial Ig-like domain (group 1)
MGIRRGNRVQRKALLVLASVSFIFLAAPARAAITQFYSANGQVALSVDAGGSIGATYTVEVQKPSASATVRNAFLMAATTGFTGATLTNTDITLAGSPVTFTSTVPSAISSNNYLGEVTSIIKPTLDAAAAGITSLTVSETTQSFAVDGTILAVVWDDPAQPQNRTVILLFGAQAIGGDTFAITLANPVDPTAPDSLLDMSLGISYSFQAFGSQQFSTVDVNTVRLTTSAGGEDDGDSNNGALITAGGLGDTNTNPSNPNGTPTDPRSDDELYSLLPLITSSTTSISVFTQNPSSDDNILFAGFVISGAAIVGEGIVLGPQTATNPVGTSHTVTATVVNAAGAPIPGETVTFNVISGPNNGTTATSTTNASGVATFTYTSNGTAGTDQIQASFVNSQNQTQTSNIVTKIWSGAPGVTICRTPGFWGTHGGEEKSISVNITLALLEAYNAVNEPDLTICGQTITNTDVGSVNSALEAICVNKIGESNGLLQLARQLTAAALNCIITNSQEPDGEACPSAGLTGAVCDTVSIEDIFNACNDACAAGETTVEIDGETVGCIGAIDCFNNGGSFEFVDALGEFVCVEVADSCHDRALDQGCFDFEPPGSAGSPGACNDARKNDVNILP